MASCCAPGPPRAVLQGSLFSSSSPSFTLSYFSCFCFGLCRSRHRFSSRPRQRPWEAALCLAGRGRPSCPASREPSGVGLGQRPCSLAPWLGLLGSSGSLPSLPRPLRRGPRALGSAGRPPRTHPSSCPSSCLPSSENSVLSLPVVFPLFFLFLPSLFLRRRMRGFQKEQR